MSFAKKTWEKLGPLLEARPPSMKSSLYFYKIQREGEEKKKKILKLLNYHNKQIQCEQVPIFMSYNLEDKFHLEGEGNVLTQDNVVDKFLFEFLLFELFEYRLRDRSYLNKACQSLGIVIRNSHRCYKFVFKGNCYHQTLAYNFSCI